MAYILHFRRLSNCRCTVTNESRIDAYRRGTNREMRGSLVWRWNSVRAFQALWPVTNPKPPDAALRLQRIKMFGFLKNLLKKSAPPPAQNHDASDEPPFE